MCSWLKFPMIFFFALLFMGVAPFAWAGHDRGELSSRVGVACNNPASVVGVIEATARGESGEFLQAQIDQGRCKRFLRAPLNFWFDRVVVDDLVWSDGTLMYVVQGHDKNDFTLFIWVPAETAHEHGWFPSPSPL